MTKIILLHYDLYIRLLLSVLFGFLTGLERAAKGKPAGIRTHILVCLGSCLIMILSVMNTGPNRDPMRLAAQVVSGIGFIGAGVIWKDNTHINRGLTTAANLWITSGVGLAIGFGEYDIAIVTAILMFLAMKLPIFARIVGLLPERDVHEDDSDGDS